MPNITREERKALNNLKKDGNHMVLTAYKGVALVVIDKDIYIEKCMVSLNDQEVYQECKDQTTSVHAKVLKQLLDLKISIGAKFKNQFIKLWPPGDDIPPSRLCGLPKNHEANISLRPTVSSCGTST